MPETVTVIGGSGFVGRQVVRALARRGYGCDVLCRDTVAAARLKTAGDPGQIVVRYADVAKPETLRGALRDSTAVVYLVGTLNARNQAGFDAIHARGAQAVAEEARQAGVGRYVYISGLGVDQKTDAYYAASKLRGEAMVREVYPDAVVLRPSLIFGAGDGFFERFARMRMVLPFLPVIGTGDTRFQPVCVDDVAEAVARAVSHSDAAGKTYELAGPDTMTLRALMALIGATTGRSTRLLTIPVPIARLMGAVAQYLPGAPITRDQVRMLAVHCVASGKLPGFEALGMVPKTLASQLPRILARYQVR